MQAAVWAIRHRPVFDMLHEHTMAAINTCLLTRKNRKNVVVLHSCEL
jgi:hypothetical protein